MNELDADLVAINAFRETVQRLPGFAAKLRSAVSPMADAHPNQAALVRAFGEMVSQLQAFPRPGGMSLYELGLLYFFAALNANGQTRRRGVDYVLYEQDEPGDVTDKKNTIAVSSDTVALLSLVEALGNAMHLPSTSGPKAAERLRDMRKKAHERIAKGPSPLSMP